MTAIMKPEPKITKMSQIIQKHTKTSNQTATHTKKKTTEESKYYLHYS